MARLYADEHVPLAVIAALRRFGHDVVRAREILPEGTADDQHFRVAMLEERLVLTQDSDFLALSAKVLEDGGRHPGVVYWPQGAYTIGQIIRKLKQYLETTSLESRESLVKFL
jgi:predicted nuclease of predicted toxin-antitoxin system